jgi:hypothetical protein
MNAHNKMPPRRLHALGWDFQLLNVFGVLDVVGIQAGRPPGQIGPRRSGQVGPAVCLPDRLGPSLENDGYLIGAALHRIRNQITIATVNGWRSVPQKGPIFGTPKGPSQSDF